jgi:4-hydroxybenzoate polyprenyltransferase
VALVAGADGWTALRLGLAMVLLQASIGTLNDLVDAPDDARSKPGKPIPAGRVPVPVARGLVVAAAGAGIVLSIPSGPALVGLAGVILVIGFGYDLAFKGTAWSWLPFAVGIPLLPVFGWFGTAGSLPASFALLLPVAVLAGAALAIANARADLERDAAAGVDSVAVRLGSERAWLVHAALLGAVVGVAAVTLGLTGASALEFAGAAIASAIVATGIVVGRRGDPSRLERAWELEAVGVGLLAAVWLAAAGLAS